MKVWWAWPSRDIYPLYAKQAPLEVWHQEVRTVRCHHRKRAARRTVCRRRLPHRQRHGEDTQYGDGPVEKGEPPQQRLPSLHRQLLHKASISKRTMWCWNTADRHDSWQLKRHPCAIQKTRHWEMPELPPGRHAGRRVPWKKDGEKICADAEHKHGGWHSERSYRSRHCETKTKVHCWLQ